MSLEREREANLIECIAFSRDQDGLKSLDSSFVVLGMLSLAHLTLLASHKLRLMHAGSLCFTALYILNLNISQWTLDNHGSIQSHWSRCGICRSTHLLRRAEIGKVSWLFSQESVHGLLQAGHKFSASHKNTQREHAHRQTIHLWLLRVLQGTAYVNRRIF